uniref:Uncharacterized protein n=1 Tax=Ganoderma boninense TaxID=34458 RepID=A0A5K1JZK5_9APHY|nr:Uncharacterized protein [Ganoderma boninense]
MGPFPPNPGSAPPATPAANGAAIPENSLGLAASIHAPTQTQTATPSANSAVLQSHSPGLAASMHAPTPPTTVPSGPPAAPQIPQPSWSSSVMDFDPMAGSGGGGNTGGFNSGFNNFFPFPINTFSSPPLGPTAAPNMYPPQPAFAPPQDGWQTAYHAAVSAQDIYRERIRDLSNLNAELQSERDSLRQEVATLRQQSERSPRMREIDTATRGNRYVPYNAETRRNGSTPPSRVNQTRDHTNSSRPMLMAPLGPVTEDELRRTSLRGRRGRPDPSVEADPHSAWYLHYRAYGPPERLPPNTLWIRDIRLPEAAIRAMGPEAEHAEAGRVASARIQHDAEAARRAEPSRTPLRPDYQPPNLARWGLIEITTVLQAHNLRHWAIYGNDIHAERFYRHLNSLYQSNPTLRRSEGIRYLLAAFSADSHLLTFERSAKSSLRRADRKRAAIAAKKTGSSPPSPPGTTPASSGTPVPPSPSAPSVEPPPIPAATPAIATLPRIPPAIVPSEAWQARAFAGRRRDLPPTLRSSDIVRTFLTLPTSEWPLGMRDDQGMFPPRGPNVFSTPLAADVYAEAFISALLPLVPEGRDERFAESAFFRGIIEAFSIPAVYPWVTEQGHYNQLLINDPAPFPYDCTSLSIPHIIAWAQGCGIDQEADLRTFVHAYAINTRYRLEGRRPPASPETEPFQSYPSRASDVIQDAYIPLIPSVETVLTLPRRTYEDQEPANGPAATTSVASDPSNHAAALPEDVDMTPAPETN